MVLTVLEADVTAEGQKLLEDTYNRAIRDLEPGIVETFLLRQSSGSSRWQIATLWESREALREMQATGGTPTGIRLFREARAEPDLVVFDVVSSAFRAEL